ncbi:unnamed protein product [Rotaria sp. Silwood1]|nr:unnamed protein product [Rotaria sp. Silwood1]CAF3746935.1 unnamed protein product [Rotaria sp. Silwood1]CAF4955115.1 unnamed protein product [Rotaria sp. Silwood1]
MSITTTSNNIRIPPRNLPSYDLPENKEDILLIWLNSNMDESEDCLFTQQMLMNLNTNVQFYTEVSTCIDLIRHVRNEPIILIVSSTLVENVLSQVHNCRALSSVIIFCINTSYVPNRRKYPKIVDKFTDHLSLQQAILQSMSFVSKQLVVFKLFGKSQRSTRDLSHETLKIFWHKVLFATLREIHCDEQSKAEIL